MVERRFGGERGVSEVRYLQGPAVWGARARGEFSASLMEAAAGYCRTREGVALEDVAEVGKDGDSQAGLILLKYNDGLRLAMLLIPNVRSRYDARGMNRPFKIMHDWDLRYLFCARAVADDIRTCPSIISSPLCPVLHNSHGGYAALLLANNTCTPNALLPAAEQVILPDPTHANDPSDGTGTTSIGAYLSFAARMTNGQTSGCEFTVGGFTFYIQ